MKFEIKKHLYIFIQKFDIYVFKQKELLN